MGIRTSRTIRSTGDRAIASSASAPWTAVVTVYPAQRSARFSESRTSGSSSTTSSRSPRNAEASGCPARSAFIPVTESNEAEKMLEACHRGL
jgi:hypothetical protein